MKKILLTLLFVFWSAVAIAAPSINQVKAAMDAGDHVRVETMLREVIVERPDSAKAHYFLAQALAKQGKDKAALEELLTSERLDPSLKFANKRKFYELKDELTYVSPAPVSKPVQTNRPSNVSTSDGDGSGALWVLFWCVVVPGLGFGAFLLYSNFAATRKERQQLFVSCRDNWDNLNNKIAKYYSSIGVATIKATNESNTKRVSDLESLKTDLLEIQSNLNNIVFNEQNVLDYHRVALNKISDSLDDIGFAFNRITRDPEVQKVEVKPANVSTTKREDQVFAVKTPAKKEAKKDTTRSTQSVGRGTRTPSTPPVVHEVEHHHHHHTSSSSSSSGNDLLTTALLLTTLNNQNEDRESRSSSSSRSSSYDDNSSYDSGSSSRSSSSYDWGSSSSRSSSSSSSDWGSSSSSSYDSGSSSSYDSGSSSSSSDSGGGW